MTRVVTTRNIAEEHGKVIVMMTLGLIREKTKVNIMIQKDAGTERDMKEEDVEVRMIVVMMMTLAGEKENIDLIEEDETHLQMMRGMANAAL